MTQPNETLPENQLTPPKTGLNRTFWTLNVMEMWERLAFFNLRVMAPIYIMQADNPGGLQLSSTEKGIIYAWWAIFQSFLPIVTGGLADRFGYKRTLAFAVSTIMAGYVMIAYMRDLTMIGNFWAVFIAIMTLATGTAFFKPSLQGSIAHQLTKANSSVGWGVFYWVVNIGAFVGHFLPSLFLIPNEAIMPSFLQADPKSVEAWRNLFLASAAFTSLNLLLLLTFRDVPSGASKTESPLVVLWHTITNILEPRLLCFLAIMSCFWMMMYQLWDLQPNFIADWVDSGGIVQSLDSLPAGVQKMLFEETSRGPMVQQQVLLSFNSMLIILCIIGVSWLVRHMRTLTAMLFGMIMATVGLMVAGWTQNGWLLLTGILFFSFGEMMTGPKKNEYLGLIAPPGKKGLYLGYVNIPIGVGLGIGSWIAGVVYGRWGEKAVLALRYLADKTPFGADKHWNGDVATLETTLGVSRPDAMLKLQEVTGMDASAATQMLWDTYSPQYIWIPFALIGVVATIALWIFGQRAKRWADMNA